MLDNAPKRIQSICILNIFAGGIGGLILGGIIGKEEILGCIIGALIGFIICYINSLVMYAFAELCINVAELNSKLNDNDDEEDDEEENDIEEEISDYNWYDVDDPRCFDESDDEK